MRESNCISGEKISFSSDQLQFEKVEVGNSSVEALKSKRYPHLRSISSEHLFLRFLMSSFYWKISLPQTTIAPGMKQHLERRDPALHSAPHTTNLSLTNSLQPGFYQYQCYQYLQASMFPKIKQFKIQKEILNMCCPIKYVFFSKRNKHK